MNILQQATFDKHDNKDGDSFDDDDDDDDDDVLLGANG